MRQSGIACSLRLMGKVLVIMFIITLMTELLLWLEQVCINNGNVFVVLIYCHIYKCLSKKRKEGRVDDDNGKA